jgi:hypothetical protein
LAEQAVGIAIYGKGHRIVIQQDSAGATARFGDGEDSTARRIAFWIVVVATVVAAVAAVLVLL